MTRDEALKQARGVLLNSQPVEHQHCICAACEDRIADLILDVDAKARRETVERLASHFDLYGEADMQRGEWGSGDVAEYLRATLEER